MTAVVLHAAVVLDDEPNYPALIRIGPSRHNYVYHLQTNSPLYRCYRGSDWSDSNDRLWLSREGLSLPQLN